MGSNGESHGMARIGWLRAAVLGANDGIVSTASLIVGVAASSAGQHEVLVAGIAALVAGAMSMAAGEYVSVSSQADTEAADLARERAELADDPDFEHQELAAIYRARGLDAATAETVASQLMAHDALGTHARDELGLAEHTTARPLQAALTSALTFAVGAALPLAAATLAPAAALTATVAVTTLLALMALGAAGAWAGGAPIGKGLWRVTFWGLVAMAATWGIGRLFHTSVA